MPLRGIPPYVQELPGVKRRRGITRSTAARQIVGRNTPQGHYAVNRGTASRLPDIKTTPIDKEKLPALWKH
jgi:hypothetical protein